jgi:hypothetical protein
MSNRQENQKKSPNPLMDTGIFALNSLSDRHRQTVSVRS